MPFSARVAGELHFCAAPNFTGSDYYLKGFFFKFWQGIANVIFLVFILR